MFHLSFILALGAAVTVGYFAFKWIRKVYRTDGVSSVVEAAEVAKQQAKIAKDVNIEEFRENKRLVNEVKNLRKEKDG